MITHAKDQLALNIKYYTTHKPIAITIRNIKDLYSIQYSIYNIYGTHPPKNFVSPLKYCKICNGLNKIL